MEGYNNQYQIRRYTNGLKRSLLADLEKTKLKNTVPRIKTHPSVPMHVLEIPQVLESLFSHVQISELKNFRLVNAHWNRMACTFLKKRTLVNLTFLADAKLENFWSTFQESQLKKLPNPFKCYNISIQIIQNEIISKILSHRSTEVSSLSYSTDQDITYYSRHFINLHKILEGHGETLRILNYTFSHFDRQMAGDGWYSSELNLSELYLPALKEISFFVWSYNALRKEKSFCKFLRQILLGAPNLQKLCTNMDDPYLLYDLLSASTAVQDLNLKKVTVSVLETLTQAELPHLKSLGLIPHKCLSSMNSELLAKVLEKFAPRIEELAISKLSSDVFPALRNLRKILLHDSSSNLKMLSPARFPNLRSIYLAGFKTSSITTAQERYEYFSTDPHFGVVNFALKCSLSCDGKDEASKLKTEQDLIFLLAFVCRQFPNISSLYLSMSKFLKGLVRSVVRFFPDIETLKLELIGDPSFPENIFTDSRRSTKPCLTDLHCLKTLILSGMLEGTSGAGSYLTINAIECGISAIPELEVFQLDWYEGMNTEVMKDRLAHLSEVIIVMSGGSLADAKIQQLQKEMPNLRVACNSDKNREDCHRSDKFDFRNYY